jgi:LPXTG-motif cell wall-anchored protein
VPEFDASTVGAIAALVAGGGVLLARRRAKKQ